MQHEALEEVAGQTRAGGRISVPAEVYPYRAGLVGGVIAGVVMALAMAGWGAFTGRCFWVSKSPRSVRRIFSIFSRRRGEPWRSPR